MSTQALLLYMFGIISALYVTHFGIYLTGANLYDIWQFKRRADSTSPIYQPLVSILIPAHNEEKVVLRCLQSIRRSSYKNFEVFVIDDASHDHTYQLARRFVTKHPDIQISVLRKRNNVGKANALNHALQHYANGELVMTLDADSLVAPDTLRNAVSYFKDNSIVGVAANVQIIDEHTVLGVLQKFEHMIGYRSKKIYSLLNCEFVIGGVASTYRMNVLRETKFYDTDTLTEDVGLSMKVISRGNITYRVIYGVDVVAMTEGVATFRALVKQRYRWKYGILQNLIKYRHLAGTRDARFSNSLVMYRLPMAFISEFALLFAPIVWGYVLYTTLSQQSIVLIAGAYLTITAYTLITIWFDEHLHIHHRLRLTFYAPIAYFLFYVMDVVQLIAIIKCIRRARALWSGGADHATWVSPERIGREISIG